MNDKDSVREFLMTRRAQIMPTQVGLPELREDRRVPGLRREEVAVLAGVSLDYYTRLERGNIAGASDSVLGAVADALLMTQAERTHLFDLARSSTSALARSSTSAAGSRGKPSRSPRQVRDSVHRLIDTMEAAAVVQNSRQDVVAANELGRVLYSPTFEMPGEPNLARFIFLDPRAQQYYVDWALARRTASAMLRMEAGRNPLDEDLTQLIGELSTRSAVFRQDWSAHHVHVHQTGRKSFRHPEVGLIEVEFDVFEMPGEPGLSIVTYSVAPGTPSAEAWSLLTSLAATPTAVETNTPDSERTTP